MQLYVNFLWGMCVTVVHCAHLDTPRVKRQLYVSTGWEDYVRKVTSVNSFMSMTWQRCLSVTFIPSLVSVHCCHFYFSCLFCKLLLEIRPLKDNLSRWERTSTGQQLVKRSIFHASKLCVGSGGTGGRGGGGGGATLLSFWESWKVLFSLFWVATEEKS